MKKKWIILITILSLIVGFGLSFNSTTLTKFILYGTIHSAINFFIVCGLVKIILSQKNTQQRFYVSLGFGLVALAVLVISYSHLFLFPYLLGSNGSARGDHFRTNTITKKCNLGGAVKSQDFQDPWYYKMGCADGQAEALSNAGFDVKSFTSACETACSDGNKDNYCHTSTAKNPDALFCSILINCPAIACPKSQGIILWI